MIQNARLFEATRRNAEEVTSASEILRALNATTDVAQAFPAVVAGVKAITVCDQVSLALIDESREYLTIVALEPYTEISWGVRVRLSETSTTPEELGALAVFFCSPAGNNVRGVAWNMDGGWAAQ